eukprot:scaffold129105_cov16-Tisochrysis_lutea.AAC.1
MELKPCLLMSTMQVTEADVRHRHIGLDAIEDSYGFSPAVLNFQFFALFDAGFEQKRDELMWLSVHDSKTFNATCAWMWATGGVEANMQRTIMMMIVCGYKEIQTAWNLGTLCTGHYEMDTLASAAQWIKLQRQGTLQDQHPHFDAFAALWKMLLTELEVVVDFLVMGHKDVNRECCNCARNGV